MGPDVVTTKRLSTPVCLSFALPGFTENMMMAPLLSILPALYAEEFGISLTTMGLLFMFARIFDAVTDPGIGYLSDRTKSRFGPRKPWIAAGQAVSLVAVAFLFIPEGQPGPFYFIIFSSLLFLGWTMLMIPYNAWTSELTGDYRDRAKLFTFRSCAVYAGAMLFSVGPLVAEPWTGSSEYDFEFMALLALFLFIAIPILTIAALVAVPQGEPVSSKAPDFRETLVAVRSNKILLLFVIITSVGALAQGIAAGLEFLYISNLMSLGSFFPMISAVGIGASLIALPLWYSMVGKFGKHRPWAASCLLYALCAPVYFFLAPGESSVPALLVLAVVLGLLRATAGVAPLAMLADIIDYDTLKSGANRAGSFYALLMLISKAGLAIGGGLGLWLAGAVGFNPSSELMDSDVHGRFLFVYALIPAGLFLLNAWLINQYPLDERRQNIIRKRLEQNRGKHSK